jgi:cellulose synthase/poly-beta-1,6-N-acetylglucosamine synthase-like glycosyltransferase
LNGLRAFIGLLALILTFYAWNSLYLLGLAWRKRREKRAQAAQAAPAEPARPPRVDWPVVTVQLPIYNEYNTVERLLDAAAGLDYPREQFEIQVLDDSDDETAALVDRKAAALRGQGLPVCVLRRSDRRGYKAGALAAGLTVARGDLLAIFDADFVPAPDFLRRAVPALDDEQVGCFQGRWTHLNREDSLLTRLEAVAIDAHFMVEQYARAGSGLLLGFNGSGGLWRKACIQDAGGWQMDTLTEDLDLSYRAQLRGWRIAYSPDLCVPGELPVTIPALLRQQSRWARGSIQTARKLIPHLLKARLPLRVKLQGFLHLTAYMTHVLVILTFVLGGVLNLADLLSPVHATGLNWLPWFVMSALGPPLLHMTVAAPEAPRWPRRMSLVPAMIVLSLGVTLNNARAACIGLFTRSAGVFERTPKYGSSTQGVHYTRSARRPVWGEVGMGLFSLAGVPSAVHRGDWGMLTWLLMYDLGFFVVAYACLRAERSA